MKSNHPGILPQSYYHTVPKNSINHSLHYYLALCGHFWCKKGYEVNRHYYKHLFLVYVLEGEFYLRYRDGEYRAGPGDAVFIDCQKPHVYGTGSGVEFYFVYLSGGQGRQICEDLYKKCGPVLHTHARNTLENGIHYLLYCLNRDKLPPPMEVSARLYRLLCTLYPAEAMNEASRLYKAISPVFEYISYNLANPITTTDMANAVHMSRSYFSRAFHKVTGQAPHEYLIKQRMEMAKQLLAYTDMTIREIAATVGYNSEVGFIQAFTSRVLTTPTRYRKAPW